MMSEVLGILTVADHESPMISEGLVRSQETKGDPGNSTRRAVGRYTHTCMDVCMSVCKYVVRAYV